MTASPLVPNTETISVELLVNGSAIDGQYPLLKVHVEREINRIPSARILLMDGDFAEQRFAGSESPDFVPGTHIDVRAGYGSHRASIFIGIVISQQFKGSESLNDSDPLKPTRLRLPPMKMSPSITP